MNNKMFNVTITALEINLGAMNLVLERLKSRSTLIQNYESITKSDLEELSIISCRIDELTIVGKATIDIG